MKTQQPALPTGTRDFGPEMMMRRTYMLDIIQDTFRRYGFLPMQTPAMEKLSTLMGKYGDEGERLLYKILDSGDFLKRVPEQERGESAAVLGKYIASKGLRYDLTVPLARYVAQHRHAITFPFKRCQLQPVWRADRPQRGRFREFYQCDADIVGGESLFYESEMLGMLIEVFTRLGIADYEIEVNHRLLLRAVAKELGIGAQELLLCGALDKLDKIGWEKVGQLLEEGGVARKVVEKLQEMLGGEALPSKAQLERLATYIGGVEEGKKALDELGEVLGLMERLGHGVDRLVIKPTLARGLGYYTGTIFEVKIPAIPAIGSVAAGGRYDDLTTIFGMARMPSIGLSFGIERIYEVMQERGLFPSESVRRTALLLVPLRAEAQASMLPWLEKLRKQGIATELYPVGPRLKKVLAYADAKKIPWVAIVGEDEPAGSCILKNMDTGEQVPCKFTTLAQRVSPANANHSTENFI